MSKTLEERLRSAKGVLDDVNTALGRHPGALPAEVEESFRKVVNFRSDIDQWVEMLEARTATMQLLDGLESKADADDCVLLGNALIKYQHIRYIGVQAYISMTWALADSITNMVGHILCTPEPGLNQSKPAKLVLHFVKNERKKHTAAALNKSIRHTFGWPIGISYAIRNHFVHDGAQFEGSDFFEGPSSLAAFRISSDGWNFIEDKARTVHNVEPIHLRDSTTWPSTPRDDLRLILDVCQREIDDALGILLGSACGSLRLHVGFMLGED